MKLKTIESSLLENVERFQCTHLSVLGKILAPQTCKHSNYWNLWTCCITQQQRFYEYD